jgi:hypothetical protein
MKLMEKFLIAVLGILIFVVIGANACTYYTIGSFDLIFVGILGILVFVETGVIVCSYNNGRITKQTSN